MSFRLPYHLSAYWIYVCCVGLDWSQRIYSVTRSQRDTVPCVVNISACHRMCLWIHCRFTMDYNREKSKRSSSFVSVSQLYSCLFIPCRLCTFIGDGGSCNFIWSRCYSTATGFGIEIQLLGFGEGNDEQTSDLVKLGLFGTAQGFCCPSGWNLSLGEFYSWVSYEWAPYSWTDHLTVHVILVY